MIRLSTGLRAALLWDAGLRQMMWRGVIEIYTGAQPATADAAPTGTLLGRITEDGDAFTPGSSTGGLQTEEKTITSIQHTGNWVLNGVGTGTPGWWRFVWNLNDTGAVSLYYPRIDGAVGESLLNMPTTISPATEIENVEFNFYFLSN